MKALLTSILVLSLSLQICAQIPDLQIEDTSENTYNLPDYLQGTQNYGIVIWSAQDPPSTAALNDYNDYYTDWVSTYNIEFIIINIDDDLTHQEVIDFANGNEWTYNLVFASSTETLEAFDINQIPYIYLVNMTQDIVYETAGWLQGNLLEDEIAQYFTVGLNELNTLSGISAYSNEEGLFIELNCHFNQLDIEVLTIEGKLLEKNQMFNLEPGVILFDIDKFQTSQVTLVRIMNELGAQYTQKVMVY